VFGDWNGVPEVCWRGPSVFPQEGAVGNYFTSGQLLSLQAPPWILRDGDDRQGLIYILPNDGPARTNTVIFLIALSNVISQCGAEVSQAAAPVVPAPRLIIPTMVPGGAFQFGIVGATNQTCVIEASADLLNWVPVATNTTIAGTLMFSDALANARPARFYRAVMSP
jgi:hypothetical protein